MRHALITALLLVVNVAVAQTNGQFVIKTGTGANTHYLSHQGNALGDASSFSPDVLWTSDNTYTQGGTNRNYYFMEGNTPHFLGAPNFDAGGALALSPSLPSGNQLSTPEAQYYFYKWDGGLGRGVRYYGNCANDPTTCVDDCGHVWGDGQCWDVYWVAFYDNTWKLSGKYYDLDSVPTGGARYYAVTVSPHAQDTTVVNGGLAALSGFEMEYLTPVADHGHQVIPTVNAFQYTVRPAYTTYVFDGGTHNYYENSDLGDVIPVASDFGPVNVSTYSWTLSGDGASHLSFDSGSNTLTSGDVQPTVFYKNVNNDGHKTATLTLTVTYSDGSKQTTSTTILVKTPCQNPTVLENEVEVSYVGATVSWRPTAEHYKVFWKEQSATRWNDSVVLGNVTSYTITGLEFETTYNYKVKATCDSNDPSSHSFTTLEEPGLMVTGAIFGGGRMADVGGKTEVVVINCDSIGAIFGGNDIAGAVLDTISSNHAAGFAGSNITLGVDASDPYGYDVYGTTPSNGKVRVSSVYGGGNGYYAYNGSSFVAATSSYTSETVAVGASVKAMTQSHQVGDVVWTNDGPNPKTLDFPSITNTAIITTNNFVKVDSIFGGAKNAFLTANSGDVDSIVINGGTVFAVFGGNNWGGSQGYGKHHIEVNGTTTNLVANITNTPTTGYGRDFGIRYLFGGGNKVAGSTTDIHIKGGQSDEVFAGGNAADVYYANVTVECSLGANAGNDLTFGNTYTNAIDPANYTAGTIDENTLKPETDYDWNGLSGIYNVRTLYGGNNEAEMQRVPTITLTSGSVGTAYGGGNAGDMMGSASTTINGDNVLYGTHVVLNSNQIIADFVYGGCRMSNVLNSTWVELKKGHVGTVYGGCNISGDVGSTRFYDPYPSGSTYPQNVEEQRVKGATYVQAGDGGSNTDLIVYKDLFAGSNGYYHCSEDGIHYGSDELFGTPATLYAGMEIPTHNETNVKVCDGATIKHNVYAGGNLASVGFDDNTGFYRGYPELVGMATVIMTGGRVEQDVYGGGNMASIFGRNEVKVSGGTIVKGLYGGNDRAGQVAEKTNRKLPTGYGYTVASDNATSLETGVMTFVGVSGNAQIGTVYGGGNGDYIYGGSGIPYCGQTPSHPIQPYTFVDINLNGGTSGGKIGTVYGGGNGVTVRGGAIVFMNNVEPNPAEDYSNVDTIFGGNNKGDLVIVPDIRLVHGQVGTVYGGCNRGAMTADENVNVNGSPVNYLQTIGGYEDIGSYVRLRDQYNPTNPAATGGSVNVTAKVKNAVYGGCRMNGVTRNSLVLLEGGDYRGTKLFGGSDISGTISGISRVAVTGGQCDTIFGGGNGYYSYNGGTVSTIASTPVVVATGITSAPICAQSVVDILGGQVGYKDASNVVHQGNAFGGGYGAETSTTGNVTVNVGPATATSWDDLPVVYGNVYGGSALGSVNTNNANTTTVNVLNGTVHGNIFGGGLGDASDASKGWTYGKVFVNISNNDQAAANCFIDLRDANVFGCNNTNGSPQDSVTVNVYKTAYNYSDYTTGDNYTATNGSHPNYAIANVFGGGNLADYAPENGSTSSTKRAIVNVFNCDNTIGRVFGGGNAAAAYQVETNIHGGRFNQVFGGGNGEVDPADIGAGGATLNVTGGIINQLFGASNEQGTINGTLSVNVSNDGSCTEDITEFFGGSNLAAMGATTPVNLVTTIDCGAQPVNITNVYGGSNQADITGNVTLNIKGGNYNNVFGGSKGVANTTAADINGDVTLNLLGGSIQQAFGGSNLNGNVTGKITVNVLDTVANCGLDLDTVYGSGNLTAYRPTNSASLSPEVNLLKGTVNRVVFGGGKGASAVVEANPVVTIGDPTHNTYSTKVYGDVFGGGNAAPVKGNTKVLVQANFDTDTLYNIFGGGNMAGVSGNTEVYMNNGKVLAGIYGGCNSSDTIHGATNLYINGGTLGTSSQALTSGIFGGGYGGYVSAVSPGTFTQGNVNVTIGDASNEPVIYGTVYGGSALGSVNSGNDDVTKVWLKKGTVNGRIYGGGLGNSTIAAFVNGGVQVLVDGGTVTNAVYGSNDQNGTPKDSVNVTINGGTVANVLGGGNLAAYNPTTPGNYPAIYITGGTVTNRVIGGGNAADIFGNPVVNIQGGSVCTEPTGLNAGVYGGCHSTGTVNGNITINLTGSAASQTTIGTQAALEAEKPINVHGGGFGADTRTTGNVTINYGATNGGTDHCDYPKLYGDLYGGSALGWVNSDHEDTTTVNLLNGSFGYVEKIINNKPVQFGGNIYGGGLGQKDDPATTEDEAVEAKVWGEVHVNVGAPRQNDSSDPFGQVSLVHCNVYGCNNTNGSPQDSVYVDVYRTHHITTDSVYYSDSDRTYAIQYLFGGGNQANYHPDSNPEWKKKVHVTNHYCQNTIEEVYGGGNAADTDGTRVYIEGGRYNYVFAGGNGQVHAANIGNGSIGMSILGGYVGYYFMGCNMHGNIGGTPEPFVSCSGTDCVCDTLVVENYYFGNNMYTVTNGINAVVNCGDVFVYRKVYAGSRLATIYGDIHLTVRGGTIGNLFGGCEGSNDISADVKKYPEFNQALLASEPDLYHHMDSLGGSALTGKGGNIYITLEGGKIGNVFGGCDFRGNVEGKIYIIVDSTQTGECALDIDYLYGGSNLAEYTAPADTVSPLVELRNGHVNFDVFGGSKGGDPNHLHGNGLVHGNPKVIVGSTNASKKFRIGRDLFGGGSAGNVDGNTDVILQGKVTIEGDVFGGGKSADVLNGSTHVTIVPNNP